MKEWVIYGILATMLVYCSATDIRSRKVYARVLFLYAGAGLILQVVWPLTGVVTKLAGIGMGGVIIALSRLTGGGIGTGDGGVLCVMGLYIGFYENLEVFLLALLLAAVWGIVLMLRKKAGRKTELPFVPFLTISYAAVLCSKMSLVLAG